MVKSLSKKYQNFSPDEANLSWARSNATDGADFIITFLDEEKIKEDEEETNSKKQNPAKYFFFLNFQAIIQDH